MDIAILSKFRGSALNQRLKDREVEEAADERDRQKEIEHIDVARRKLIEERDPNAESVILQMEQKMQEHLRRRLVLDGPEPSDDADGIEANSQGLPDQSALADNKTSERVSRSSEHKVSSRDNHEQSNSHPSIASPRESPSQSTDRSNCELQRHQLSEFAPTSDETSAIAKDSTGTFVFAMSAAEPVVRKKAAAFIDEESEEKAKKHTPSWLPPSAFKASTTTVDTSKSTNESASIAQLTANMTNEQKKAVIKRIIDSIPTGKRELFNYPIDWELVDATFVSARIKPWVDKKIVGYIGEAEVTLSNFICDQLVHHNPPERILADIAMVLDEEAEVFVVKMWRLLIYVIAEKKAGLSA